MAARADETRSRPARRRRVDAGPQAVLVRVLAAAQPGAGASRHALLDLDEVRLGRGSRSGRRVEGGRRVLDLRVPDAFASRHHARMVRAADGWLLEDARSTNGLRVNGSKAERRRLEDGDLFEIGETFFLFRSALAVPPTAPPDLIVTPADGPAPGMATVLPDLARAFADLARAARSPVAVLLRGETGTGKEVLARAVHQLSRRSGPLVVVHCGAGSVARLRRGFGDALGGTLFLDEIAELPLASQSALLRLVGENEQERETRGPGRAARKLRVVTGHRRAARNVRIITASNSDLGERVRAGRFREDLLARLRGHEIELPPLRARREDLGLLIAALWRPSSATSASPLSLEAAWALLRHEWPQNVRELEQTLVATRALASERIELDDLPGRLRANAAGRVAGAERSSSPAEEARRDELHALLASHGGNVSRIARALGTSRAHVRRLCARLGFEAAAFRGARES